MVLIKKEHKTSDTCPDGVIGIRLDLPSLTSIKLEKKYVVYKHFNIKVHVNWRKGKYIP